MLSVAHTNYINALSQNKANVFHSAETLFSERLFLLITNPVAHNYFVYDETFPTQNFTGYPTRGYRKGKGRYLVNFSSSFWWWRFLGL